MKRSIAILLACWFTIVIAADTHFYGDVTTPTANAGVYWNLGQHWCGVEYRGHPGPFCDTT
jgi:hypothetical protein